MAANRKGGYGPEPNPARDGDKVQARQRVNMQVKRGKRPHPNALPCVDCGHMGNDRRHEYDHYLGYAAKHHYHVQAVCTTCHARRDSDKAKQTHCIHGHKFTPENTIIKTNGCRACRECRRAHDRRRVRPSGFWKAVNARRRERNHGR